MATVTRRLAEFDDGRCYFEMDYDDSTLRVSAFRAVNNTDQAAYGQIIENRTRRARDMRFPPGKSVEIAIPTTGAVAQRLQLREDERGRIVGADFVFLWPYP